MALKITDACINCGACVLECPNNAIYQGAINWTLAEGTNSQNHQKNEPLEDDFFYIVSQKCTECVGFHDEPQCAFVCPADCCIPNFEVRETKSELLIKKELLHK